MFEIFIALTVVVIYLLTVFLLKKRGMLNKYNISTIGPILLIRTTKGLNFLDKLARYKKFWRSVADLGLPLVFLSMGFMFSLVLFSDYIILTNPPKPSPLTSPRNVLLLPGINEFIPVLWGGIGLVVTLIVHEFSHAILCRVEGVKVKALGILLCVVPIGGFAEPDERDLKTNTNRTQRIRIFSAGVVSNYVTALIAFSAFFYLLGFVNPTVVVVDSDIKSVKAGSVILKVNGIPVRNQEDVYEAIGNSKEIKILLKDKNGTKTVTLPNIMGVKIIGLYKKDNEIYPAERVGIKAGMVIVAINDKPIKNFTEFREFMQNTKPGQVISVKVYHNGSFKTFNVTLADMNGKGFLGVYIQNADYIGGISITYSSYILESLRNIPITSIKGWLYMIAMPFRFQGFIGSVKNYFEAPEYVFNLLNALYWIAWLNFYVGLFNCLPAIPLDGGRIFYEAFSSVLSRKYKDNADEIAMNVVKFLAIVVFSSIILSILIPNLRLLK